MELQLRQLRALIYKDLLLLFNRRASFSTVFRAFLIPIIVGAYLTIIFRVYWPKAQYGIGSAQPVRNLVDAMNVGNNGTLVLLNNASSVGGEIDRVIEAVARPVRDAGRSVRVVRQTEELRSLCRPSLQGNTDCFAAAVFQSSPTEGPYGIWNYTLRGDSSLGRNGLDVLKHTNDGEIYIWPLQHAIDRVITSLATNGTTIPQEIDESLFTSKTQEQWRDDLRLRLIGANVNFASVVWLLTLIGVTFQLVTLMAMEREREMSDLIEAMMPNKRRWECQALRLTARHIAFDITYAPSWVIIGLFMKAGYYKHSSAGIAVIGVILAGLALTSFSLLGGAFFKKAQLSSIIVVGVAIGLGIACQVTSKNQTTATAGITGFLFTPMAIVNYFIFCAKWEREQLPINLTTRAPATSWSVPGIAYWIFFIIQIIAYPILAALVERWLYGTAASRSGRTITQGRASQEGVPVSVKNANKIYKHSWFYGKLLGLFGKLTEPVIAVQDLSLEALQGQVMVLVGANGCGKTTTLNAIAGLSSMSSGHVTVDGSYGIGICPQKNVLWDQLTVRQHARIFNKLKSNAKKEVGKDLSTLYRSCGLEEKKKMPSKSLSGGQKRKLQLLMMLTGDSRVCCVDEASGGLDPLSRRKIWDILLSERGSRTVILTTHFLDEAEFLADQMVIMSKGHIKAVGSVSELKQTLGNGYRVHVVRGKGRGENGRPEQFQEVEEVADPAAALEHVKYLESQGITNYQIAGPTIEEVFMKLAADKDAEYEEMDEVHPSISRDRDSSELSVKYGSRDGLVQRHKVGAFKQLLILLRKRFTVYRRNPAPLTLALIMPIVAAGLISILLDGVVQPGCGLDEQFSSRETTSFADGFTPHIAIGPQSAINLSSISLFTSTLPSAFDNVGGTGNSSLLDAFTFVNSLGQFNDEISRNYANITPGGIWLGDSTDGPAFATRSDLGIIAIFFGVILQNAMNVLLSGTRIATQYTVFDFAFPNATDETIQFTFYFGLVMSSYPAFFALYVCQERIKGIKAMEFSNGVRPFPLWAASTLFDWFFTVVSTVVIIIIFAAARGAAWYGLGYLFLVLLLYGLASVLLSYMIASFAKSQFAAFALVAGGQGIMLLIYLTAYLTILAQSPADKVDQYQTVAHYAIGSISPIAQLLRAMLLGLNLFSVLCRGSPPTKVTNPGAFDVFGGPIVFLIYQIVLMFLFLVWKDHRYSLGPLRRKRSLPGADVEHKRTLEPEVAEEEARVATSNDGLRVQHVDKTFTSIGRGAVHAVEDVTFGVKSGEVFALLGPNGAGKSTTISMLQGETTPSGTRGDLFIQDISVLKDRYSARFHLGVCPQFDAMDKMSVREHLAFYARVRGVTEVSVFVERMIRSVGLQPFADRMAETLSGGNKRKLSLAMALIGNPEVVLLDEPSSGMDPLAKRNMWKTLAKFRPGRSILLTTHSMEEADALASRVGFIARRLLDIGTTDHLRRKHGHGFHLHMIMASAPRTSDREMEDVKQWIEQRIPGSKLNGYPYHGQMRFTIPATSSAFATPLESDTEGAGHDEEIRQHDAATQEARSVASLFKLFEENKQALGVEFYSVSPSTFDEVFLKVVDRHDVDEEGEKPKRKSWFGRKK